MQAARHDAEAKSRALDRLNRQTTLILSILAHDLRNPFQVLLGMSETLADRRRRRSHGHRAPRGRRSRGRRSGARADGKPVCLGEPAHGRARQPAPVAVDGAVRRLRPRLERARRRKGVRIETQATDARVLAQEDAVAAILRNLVANALKFTAAGGA